MDEMSKTAQRIGTATENIAGLQLAFELGGSSAEGMQTAMVKLADQAAEGSKAFAALGVNVRTADGHLKDTRALIAEVADKFAGYADGASKTALAVELFGRSGAELIPILNGGAAGLADMDEQARKLGLTIDSETARAAEYFNDQMALVKKQAEGLATQFTVGLMPSLLNVADAFLTSSDGADTARAAGENLGNMLVWLAQRAAQVAATFRILAVEIAYALSRAGAWADKQRGQNDIRANAEAEYRKTREAIQEGRKLRIAAGEDLKAVNESTRQALEGIGTADDWVAKRIEQSNKQYAASVEAMNNTRIEMLGEIVGGLEDADRKLVQASKTASDISKQIGELRNLPQAPALPDSGAGKPGKGSARKGGGRRAGGARNADDKAASQYARHISSLREEAERLQYALDQMQVNDGLVPQYTKLVELQRDMRHNAEQYKELTVEQTGLLQAQAVIIDRLAQQRAVADYRGDNQRALDDMRFEIEMIGKTADEVDRLAFAREQDLRVKELSAGASDETIAALQAEAQQAKDTYAALQQLRNAREEQAKNAGFSWSNLFQNLADNTQSYAQVMEDSATRAFDSMGDAIGDLVATGKANFRDLATSVLQDISKMLAKWAIFKTVTTVANAFGFSFQANGGAWANGVQFFASGGVVNRPTLFGHAGGLGVMGEAGPEAILPLRRGRNGKLGVQFDGSGGQNITINHTTIINNADGSSTTESDAPAAYKTLLDAHFDKRLADALRPGAALDSAIKQRSR